MSSLWSFIDPFTAQMSAYKSWKNDQNGNGVPGLTMGATTNVDGSTTPSTPGAPSDPITGIPYPDFQSPLNSDGTLKNPYLAKAQPDVQMKSNMPDLNSRLDGIQLDRSGVNAMKDRALGSGDSVWGKLMLDKQATDESMAHDRNAAATAGSFDQARNQMMMGSGMTRGAGERLALDEARQRNQGDQGVTESGIQAREGIRTQDQQLRDQFLGQLPGAEVASLSPELQKTSMWSQMAGNEQSNAINLGLANRNYTTGVDESNIGNELKGLGGVNDFNLAKYQEQMKAYGANQTANAQAKAGKK